MKKRCFLFSVFCLAITLFYMAGNVTAAPSFNKEAGKPQNAVHETQNWPIAAQYQNKGEIWPPVAGRYERKNPNGLANSFIHVAVLPNQWPVINLHGCEYNGPADEHGWEALTPTPASGWAGPSSLHRWDWRCGLSSERKPLAFTEEMELLKRYHPGSFSC